jgi:hypothetical protein
MGHAMSEPGTVACFGCGAVVPDIEGPTHRYLGAPAGCWAAFNEIMAKEFGEYVYPECHRLTVDTYAVQHPGTPSPQTIQSVGGHLVSLHLVLERGLDSKKATRALGRVVDRSAAFVWLEPPTSPGWLTVLGVSDARDLEEHQQRVRLWAESAWEGWSAHHDTVRRWANLP